MRSWLFSRTLGASLVLLLAIEIVSVATDEAGNTPGMRLARLAALVPVAASVAVLAVAAHAQSRGEVRALVSLGTAPWESLRGARNAAFLFCMAAPLLLLLPVTDPVSLFPSARSGIEWVRAPDDSAATGSGVRVESNGRLSLVGGSRATRAISPGRAEALLAVVPLALVAPFWAVSPMGAALRMGSVALTAALSIFAFHAAAASPTAIVAKLLLCAAALPLAVVTMRARTRLAPG